MVAIGTAAEPTTRFGQMASSPESGEPIQYGAVQRDLELPLLLGSSIKRVYGYRSIIGDPHLLPPSIVAGDPMTWPGVAIDSGYSQHWATGAVVVWGINDRERTRADAVFALPDGKQVILEFKMQAEAAPREVHSQIAAEMEILLRGFPEFPSNRIYYEAIPLTEFPGETKRATGATTYPRFLEPWITPSGNSNIGVLMADLLSSSGRSATQPRYPSLSDRLRDLRHATNVADVAAAHRIDFLRTPEDDDDDVPLSESAALGFLEFLERIDHPQVEPSLTTTRGWLCSTWRFDEGGPVLVIWFKDRSSTMLTALPRGSDIPEDIGQDPRSQNSATLVELLDEHRIFSRRVQE